MKRVFAICLALVMVLSLASCGGPRKPEDVMSKTAEKMAEMESTSMFMDMTITMGAMGMEIPMNIHGEGDVFLQEQRAHLAMTVDMAIAAMNMEVYTEKSGDEMLSYMGMDMGTGMEWMRTSTPAPENSVKVSIDSIKLIKGLTQAEETETINGVEAVRYDGVITGNTIPKLLAPMLQMNGMEEAMGDLGGMEGLMEGIDPNAEIHVTCYVDQENLTLARMDVEMTDLFAGILEQTLAEAGISLSGCTISVGYSNYNQANDFEIPQEALSAPEV